jgi:hypothetical protein
METFLQAEGGLNRKAPPTASPPPKRVAAFPSNDPVAITP